MADPRRTRRRRIRRRCASALADLIALKQELIDTEVYRPNPTANCFWCDFKSLCPLFPEGQPVFDVAAVAMSTGVAPAEVTAAMGAEPTDEQWSAIAWPLEPCVLIAGAGSGKTSVMAARVVYLALGALGRVDAPGVMPGNVLCLTFTNKATENLRLRVRRALAHLELAEGEEPEIMNYHGFAASLLDRYGVLAGFEPGARVLDQAQREELCGRVLDRMTFDHAARHLPALAGRARSSSSTTSCRTIASGRPRRSPWLHDRLETLKNHQSERSYRAAEERIELTEAAILIASSRRSSA